MKTIWFYFSGENPMKYFFRNDCQPTSGFCFFSSREKVVRHFLKCHGCDFTPEGVDEVTWSESVIENAPSELLEKWLKEYLEFESDSEFENFGEMTLDLLKFKGE